MSTKRTDRIMLAVLALSFALTLFAVYSAYRYYEQTLVDERKSQATVMAETASSNLYRYIDRFKTELDVQFSKNETALAGSRDFEESVGASMESLEERDQGRCEIAFVTPQDETTLGMGVEGADAFFQDLGQQSSFMDEAREKNEAFVAFWSKEDSEAFYRLYLFKQVFDPEGSAGFVVESIRLDTAYEETLAGVKIGEHGYCTVKDPDETIVMHEVPGQIGLNVLEDRRSVYQGDWEALAGIQYDGESGCEIVTSYWWDDVDSGSKKKFIAYAPLMLDGNYFVVSVVSSYDEVMQPLETMSAICGALTALLVIVVVLVGWKLMRNRAQMEYLSKELAYETALLAQTKQLKLQERQIQHIDSLQTMGILSSAIGHEMKNALTPVSIYGQMLESDLDEEERKGIVEEINRALERCSTMVERMLAYVRPRHEETNKRTFDAASAIEECLETVTMLAPANVSVESDVESEECVLQGDQAAFTQIMLNLATNAFYAMAPNGGTLSVRWTSDERFGRLAVSDTGCGMDEETKNRLFESFYTTKGDEGTGLGLMVVQSIVHGMKGSIDVQSELGTGTTFAITIPRANSASRF